MVGSDFNVDMIRQFSNLQAPSVHSNPGDRPFGILPPIGFSIFAPFESQGISNIKIGGKLAFLGKSFEPKNLFAGCLETYEQASQKYVHDLGRVSANIETPHIDPPQITAPPVEAVHISGPLIEATRIEAPHISAPSGIGQAVHSLG